MRAEAGRPSPQACSRSIARRSTGCSADGASRRRNGAPSPRYPSGMKRAITLFVLAACGSQDAAMTAGPRPPGAEGKDLALPQEAHLHNLHQLTFGGNSAEAYWSFAGDRLIMQTDHAPYKCDQIEELEVATGKARLGSTGKGRTTCSYFLKG